METQRTDAIAVPCETAPFGNNRNGERETRTVKGLPEGTHKNLQCCFYEIRQNCCAPLTGMALSPKFGAESRCFCTTFSNVQKICIFGM